MRIFLAGDHLTGTGPANVTKYYIENLPKNTLFQKQTSKFARVPEMIINTIRSDVVVYSGYSRQNLLGIRLAHIFHKPFAYLMHGCVEFENEINHEEDAQMSWVERKTIEEADMVMAVSPSFAKWLKEYYPQNAGKIYSLPNGIDAELKKLREVEDVSRDVHMIFTIGGGMPRKKIKHICEAVELLRKEYDKDLKLYVVGNTGADTDKINSYDCLVNEGLVPFERTKELLAKASVFVQNSCFETFGLAPVEAVAAGCSLLCSKEIGALCVFREVEEADVIANYEDSREIADKIKKLLISSNNDRLSSMVDWELYSWEERTKEMERLLKQLLK